MSNETSNMPGVVVPDEEHDYHGHPNYNMVYIMLLVLFGLGVGVGYLGHTTASILLIFGTAVIKAWMIVANFMHLKFEPKLAWLLIAIVLFIVLSFYFGVFPDITPIELNVVKK